MWTEVPFNPKLGYPVGKDLYYECTKCTEKIPSTPADSIGCRCGNVFIDVDAGRVSVRDDAHVRLWRKHAMQDRFEP